MAEFRLQQKGERRVAAALRIALVILLLAGQIALVVGLAYLLEQRAAIVYALLQAAAFVAALAIFNRRGDAMYKLSWIMLLLTVPVVGFILFLLWSEEPERRRMRRSAVKRPEEPESAKGRSALCEDKLSRAMPAWSHLATSLRRRDFLLFQDTQVHYFPEGALLLDDLIQRCERAERFIFLEYFILAEGRIWDRLSAVLRERAAAGVEVRIIFDDFGNIRRFSEASLEELRAAGVEVHIFNPVHKYVNRLYFNYRDHRKIACVDGDTAYTGGVNIADEYANLITRFGYWKDSGVRLDGDGAWGLTAAFIDMWNSFGDHVERERDYYRPHRSVRGEGWCQPFVDGPLTNPDAAAEDVFLQLISGARRFLYITTPYFVPDDTVMRALCIAGDGGVDVRLMLPGIPDHRYTDLVAESYLGELLEHGVKVYRYTPGFLHGKSVMVDRELGMVGSVNMDYRSFRLHHECGVVFSGCAAVEQLLEDMDGIVQQSRQLSLGQWRRRSWARKAVEPFLRLFAIWM